MFVALGFKKDKKCLRFNVQIYSNIFESFHLITNVVTLYFKAACVRMGKELL